MSRPKRAQWTHLRDIPPDVRQCLERASRPFEEADGVLEKKLAVVLGPHPKTHVRVLRTMRAARLLDRVPALVPAVQALEPRPGLYAAFEAVALHLGLSIEHVRDIYYRERNGCKD